MLTSRLQMWKNLATIGRTIVVVLPSLYGYNRAFVEAVGISCLKLSSVSLAITVSLACGLVQAQTSPLETITVTGQRQQAALADINHNLSVIGANTIANISHEHINQALVRVPGAWVSRGNGQEHLTAIRSPVLTGAGGCGAFFIAQDGISLRAPGFCNANQLFDANTEQAAGLEVVRGPASTLYGSNAVHGVINLLTPDAFGAPMMQLGLESGPDGYHRGRFSIGHQDDTQATLLYGNLTSDDGYQDESGFDQQKINAIHQYRGDQFQIKTVLAVTNLNQETAGFIRGFEAYRDVTLRRQNPNPEAFRDSQSARLYSRIDYRVNEGSTLSITPFLRWADMQFLQHFLPWQALEENSQQGGGVKIQFSQQLDDVQLLTGFDWDATKGELQETQEQDFSPSIPAGSHYDYEVDASVYSPFAQVIWQANDALTLQGGLRFERTEYDYDNRLSDGSACAPEVDNCRFTRPADQEVTFNEWSYQLAAGYQINDWARAYSQFSRGYRAPQATELFRLQAGQQIADLDAETLKGLEIGVRGQYQNLFFDVSWFDMDKDNFIFQDTDRQNVSNGETSHTGVELSLRYTLPANFYVAAAATYADHTYEGDLTLSRTPIRGNEIDTAPQHMGSMQVGWLSPQGHSAELEWVHQGNYFLDPQNTADYSGHNLLNLRGFYRLNDKFTLQARVLNLTDEDYAERADFAFGSYRYFVGEPRSLYLGVQFQLN